MRRLALLTLVPVLLLTGCVPSQPQIDPDTGAGMAESTAWFLSLGREEQLKVAARQDAETEREMWKIVGLDDSLGGEKAADEVFGEMQAGLATVVQTVQGQDDGSFALASFKTSNFDEAIGAGSFGNMIIGDALNQIGMDLTKNGEEGSDTKQIDETSEIGMDSQGGTVSTRYDGHTTYKGVDVTLKVRNQVTPCPDADGKVHAEGTYTLVVSAPDGHGMISEVTVEDDIEVGDDAQKVGSAFSYYAEYSDNASGDEIISYQIDANGTFHMGSGGYASKKGQSAALSMGSFFAGWIARSLEEAAQKGWESGRCITLNVSYSDGPSGLDPNDKVTLTVSPVAKSDGARAGGTVTAKLKDGSKSVSPSGEKVKADAVFTYTAPEEKDRTGTVHLESRSKRGVGILDVTLDTKAAAYTLSGGGGEISMSGQTCDIGKPFSVSGTGLTMAFTPSGSSGGSWTLSGTIGVPWTGSGTYTVSTSSGGGTLTATGDYTVTAPMASFTKPGVFSFTMTPLKDCS